MGTARREDAVAETIALLRCLLRRAWSLTELGLELEVDLDTLRADLQALRAAGLPVEWSNVKGRRYYRLDPEVVARDLGLL
jgi:biotin operon repressor